MMLDVKVLGENIKKYRKIYNITQNELAEKLFVSAQSVSKWECGNSVPELAKLCEMAEIFNVTVDSMVKNSKYVPTGKVLIGIDGGGTKTEFVLFEENGTIIKRIVLDGCNPNSCGVSRTCEILQEGIDTLLEICPNVVGIYAGYSGAIAGDPEKKIWQFLKSKYPKQKIECDSDVLNIVASSADLKNDIEKCVAVICGTGSVAYLYDGDKSERVGGWGYLLDGAGSGYDFGRDALCAALAQRDEIGDETLITPMVENKIGGGVWEQLGEIYRREKGFIASFAPIVFEAYKQGDKVAEQIVEKNINRLALMINRAARTLKDGDKVVLAGGLMVHSDIFIRLLSKKTDKKLTFFVPVLPQIYGACVLCCKMCGIKNDTFLEKFKADYEKII